MTPLDVPALTPPVDMEHRFFELSLDLLCYADFSGYFRRLNPAWEATLGFTRAELMARPSIEFVHPEDRERTIRQNREVKSGGQARSFENRYRCKDGSWRWLLWNATPDLDRRVIYSVARDVTARKAAEAERERLVIELQAALAEVRTLRDYLPICSYCRKIRNDENYWQNVESYITSQTGTQFSHGICPSCYTTVMDEHLASRAPDRQATGDDAASRDTA
ncbi:PAS domain S-box protein [Luteitalea pratensis]|uniref:PAS domain S-box protein n=1 Tax=Luteitalea pratensis TaxID=1855912 RepID=A0A143PLB5_LUTPR|nr:PAS domain S-box protein [Luteitalea pratensis]AMY08888.1 PAS domain S-box protein [Luteitalea pratensis]